MIVYGFELIISLLEQDGFLFKMLANDSGAVFFPHTTEHRNAAQPGIKYADDSGGNALAAMVMPGRIEFRYHRPLNDELVRQLVQRIMTLPELELAHSLAVIYQLRTLVLRNEIQAEQRKLI